MGDPEQHLVLVVILDNIAKIQLRLNVCHWDDQPVRTVPPVAQPGQWPGHEHDRSLGSLCPEISPELPCQTPGQWRRIH